MFGKKDKVQSPKAPVKGATRKGATRPSASPKAASPKAGAVSAKTPAPSAAKTPKAGNKKSGSLRKPSSFSTLIQYHRECLKASRTRLTDGRLATAMTSALVAVSLTLPMLLLLVVSNLQQLTTGWQDQLSLSVYLDSGMADAQSLKVVNQVQSLESVDSVTLISPEQGLEEFQGVAGAELLSLFESNPLPAVIEVVPRLDVEDEQYPLRMRELVRQLEALNGVDEVSYDLQWVQRLINYVGLAERFALLIGILLALAAVLAISNSIRLEIENRRQEIIVIKLVGGTDSFIRLPFLYSGFWYGVLGATLATVCLWLIGLWLSPFVSRLLSLYSSDVVVNYLGLVDVLKLYLCSVILAVTGAWLAVYRHLGEIEPE
ncbi:permease-like cell division protein FtsX [Litoribrevibacter albus]|uniref:Cell division protein FtsX n=1 Tax=Litoribrevibacter albus TaxID=1473156 RepID=A0AA37S7J1_9GAMM|nr:permease-like cell division protein FtsX [Litoribrevibacter albus]GLQ30547.1 cell division protein FtsX [Litoribrevibacter albus]